MCKKFVNSKTALATQNRPNFRCFSKKVSPPQNFIIQTLARARQRRVLDVSTTIFADKEKTTCLGSPPFLSKLELVIETELLKV